jgi:hypothetical protein
MAAAPIVAVDIKKQRYLEIYVAPRCTIPKGSLLLSAGKTGRSATVSRSCLFDPLSKPGNGIFFLAAWLAASSFNSFFGIVSLLTIQQSIHSEGVLTRSMLR